MRFLAMIAFLRRYFLLLALLLACLCGRLLAQPGSLPEEQRKFQLERSRIEGLPEIIDKPQVKLPPPDLSAPERSLGFQPPGISYQPSLAPPDLNRTDLPKPRWPRLRPFRLKAGLGRFTTPLVEASASNGLQGRNPRLGWTANYRHLSTPNGHVDHANFGDNELTARSQYHLDRQTLFGELGFFHRTHNFYGDSAVMPLEEVPDSLEQRFTRVNVLAGIRSRSANDLQYEARLRLRSFSDRFDNSEFHTTLAGRGSYRLDSAWSLRAPASFTFSSVDRPALLPDTDSRTHISLSPGVEFRDNRLRATGSLLIANYNSAELDTNITHVLPQLRAEYAVLPDSQAVAFLSFGGKLHHNTLYERVDDNPYLDPQRALVLPTRERLALNGGVRSQFGRLTTELNVYVKSIDLQPVYYTPPADTLTPNAPEGSAIGRQGRFLLLYEENFNTFGAVLAVDYDWAERVNAGARVELRSFDLLANLDENYHVPTFRGNLHGGYLFADKLYAGARLNLIGERPIQVGPAGELREADFLADLNLKLEYFFSSRFSLWGEANNLFDQDYIRWSGYIERGLDFKFGGTVNF